MIFEIRNYHYEPSMIGAYRAWAAAKAVPYIRNHLDLVGFWVNFDEAPIVGGKPLDELGSATVTWIIRWDDMQTRNRVMGGRCSDPRIGRRSWQPIQASNTTTAPRRNTRSRCRGESHRGAIRMQATEAILVPVLNEEGAIGPF